jgi:DNA-binding NarL/FixJ family response regulator
MNPIESNYENSFSALIIDDLELIRIGLKNILKYKFNIKIFQESDCIDKSTNINNINLVFIDLKILEKTGNDFIFRIRKYNQNIKIIVTAINCTYSQLQFLIKNKIDGILNKNAPEKNITNSILIAIGSEYNTEKSVQMFWQNDFNGLQQTDNLSQREVDVLKEICNQFSAKEIANKLYIAENTVNNHRRNIMDKTGINNSVGLVIYAIKNGIYQL